MEGLAKHIARLLCAHCGVADDILDTPGAGAAGGIAFGLMAAASAKVLSGFDLTSDWLKLADRIHSADVVLTGEGRFDESSAQGKGPGAILELARAAGRTAHVFAGSIAEKIPRSPTLHSITPLQWKLEDALRATPQLLRAGIQRQFSK
jgi:glycerate kinase